MAKKKSETPETNFERAVTAWRTAVGFWLADHHGRQAELATALQVQRYQINDWFISRRKAPPLWVVWAINSTLILRETTVAREASTRVSNLIPAGCHVRLRKP